MISFVLTLLKRTICRNRMFNTNKRNREEEKMEPITLIQNFYKKDSKLYNILVGHSTDVMNKALTIIENHPELNADFQFVAEAAMLHDIGIFLTDAPSIECHGIAPYLCHGYLGRELLDNEGYPLHALVCERHTGTGLRLGDIIAQNLPLPRRDMVPVTIEEQIICFADCFFSKTKLGEEKKIEDVKRGLMKHGIASVNRFEEWCQLFL